MAQMDGSQSPPSHHQSTMRAKSANPARLQHMQDDEMIQARLDHIKMKLERAQLKKVAEEQRRIEEARKKAKEVEPKEDDYVRRLAEFVGRKNEKKKPKERPAGEKTIYIDTFKELHENYQQKKEEKLGHVQHNLDNLRRQ